MLKLKNIIIATSITLFTANVLAADNRTNTAFVILQTINILEVYAGYQQIQGGKDQGAIDYATAIVTRHAKLYSDVQTFIDANGIDISNVRSEEPMVAELTALNAAVEKLADLEAESLDKAFVALMVKVHDLSLRNLKQAQRDFGESTEGKFLVKLLTQVQDGYDKAVELNKRLNPTPAGY